jgi:hypothetical protein
MRRGSCGAYEQSLGGGESIGNRKRRSKGTCNSKRHGNHKCQMNRMGKPGACARASAYPWLREGGGKAIQGQHIGLRQPRRQLEVKGTGLAFTARHSGASMQEEGDAALSLGGSGSHSKASAH